MAKAIRIESGPFEATRRICVPENMQGSHGEETKATRERSD